MAKFVSFQIIHHILSQLVATASTFCDKWPARDNNLSHIAEKMQIKAYICNSKRVMPTASKNRAMPRWMMMPPQRWWVRQARTPRI